MGQWELASHSNGLNVRMHRALAGMAFSKHKGKSVLSLCPEKSFGKSYQQKNLTNKIKL